VTMVDGKTDHWLPYVAGCTVALDVHPADEPFTRGAPYIWCRRVIENGNASFPTSPLFGRFIEQAGSRPKVLAGEGQSEVVGAEYVYCFRAVGVLHGSERQFFPRSEVPAPVPDSVTRQDLPAAFDTLQHSVKHLGQLMENLCDVADMADELIVAEKETGDFAEDRLTRVHHEARAYRALQSMLNAAMAQSSRVGTELAGYLKASPELAYWLKRRRTRPCGSSPASRRPTLTTLSRAPSLPAGSKPITWAHRSISAPCWSCRF
jgi:hypothetical protein